MTSDDHPGEHQLLVDGRRIAYRQQPLSTIGVLTNLSTGGMSGEMTGTTTGAGQGTAPGVLFCGGFNSSMLGIKASALAEYCLARNVQFTRFDYTGHGASSGEFVYCGIDDWLRDTLDILDRVCSVPQILIGSSMGAWIAALAALARPGRVTGLLTIAAAPDFTEELIWQKMSNDVRQKLQGGEAWLRASPYDDGSPYQIGLKLIDSGRQYRILNRTLDITCPVRLLHGTDDEEIPWHFSQRLMQRLRSRDACLTLVKNGDHRLSTETQLQVTFSALEQLLKLSK